MKTCPFCAEEIQDEAIKCKHCGADLVAGTPGMAAAPASRASVPQGAIVAVLGGLLVAVGSFLPWVTAASGLGTVSKSGMEGGDGTITLVLGIAIIILALAPMMGVKASSVTAVLLILAAAGAGFIGFVNMKDVQERVASVTSEYVSASVGAGLWALLIGAVVAFLGGIAIGYKPKAATA